MRLSELRTHPTQGTRRALHSKMLPSFQSSSSSEKQRSKVQRSHAFRRAVWTALLLGAVALTVCSLETQVSNAVNDQIWSWTSSFQQDAAASLCPQQDPYKLDEGFANLDQDLLADRLSKAVQIDTSVGDNWPDPNDEPDRWQAFSRFADWLKQTFPQVHEQLEIEKVHHHGLLYTWKGSDDALKPLLMMAHQDVVPVNQGTLDQWRYPPFSGFIDQEAEVIWGRGSTDCKAWLISILSSVEGLLSKDWKPKRTIMLSFGFDEESSGRQGAAWLAARIEEIWGRDSIAMIVDEGNPVLSATDPWGPGIDVALPGVAEKGSVDLEVLVETAGGHSSTAGAHTSIGLLARLVAQLEDKRDTLTEDKISGPELQFLQCVRNGPKIPPALRSALKDLEWASRTSIQDFWIFSQASSILPYSFALRAVPALSAWLDRGRDRRIRRARERVVHTMPPSLQTQFITTTAVDIIHGGVKFNALPESASAFVDHRISITSSYAELQKHYIDVLTPVAEKYNMALFAFGKQITNSTGDYANVTIREAGSPLEPAPWTPLDGEKARPWHLFSQLVRSVWTSEDGSPVLVAPSIMQGNTDTRYTHNLTRNIIRFGPSTLNPDKTGLGAYYGIHTVNEHYPIKGLADSTNFYTALFQAVSVSDI